ncbi:class I SAM-dependent methyltransferase [Rubrivivax sp. RP6-9]|uniref:class I SAM-dependent methyltransferase n=1 Tax=Rubrivivax sp. RP6-9 TaxID=3415750 RepID=UPI003CC62E00
MPDHRVHFADPAAVASYAASAVRQVPGLSDLHRMTALLLAEHAPTSAQVLVVGAGGGLELAAMAAAQPGWHFTGVDPASAMLEVARAATAAHAQRVHLVTGTVDQAPEGPFDGATCLLTLHFMDRVERLHVLQAMHRRLRPGARLVVAHHAPPGPDAARWMARSAAYAQGVLADPARAATAGRSMTERLPLLTPADDEDLLRAAGFEDVALFYAAFSFRGWVATSRQSSARPPSSLGGTVA